MSLPQVDRSELLRDMAEFVAGARPPLDYLTWWTDHADRVQRAFSPGVALRLKPRGVPQDKILAVWRCLRETRTLLEREGVVVESNPTQEEWFQRHFAKIEDERSFTGVVIDVAMHHYAAVPLDRTWLAAIRGEFEASGAADLRAWLKDRLRTEFLCIDVPPKWIHEPEWPFRDGKPLVFIHQFHVPETDVSREHFTFGDEVFVFGRRVPHEKGNQVEYVLVEQCTLISIGG